MTIITADGLNTKYFSKRSRSGKDATVEDFWSGIEEEVERKKKLEQELLTLEEGKKEEVRTRVINVKKKRAT